jgi:hypothetical protein
MVLGARAEVGSFRGAADLRIGDTRRSPPEHGDVQPAYAGAQMWLELEAAGADEPANQPIRG